MKLSTSLTLINTARALRVMLLSLVVGTVAACSTPPANHPAGEPWDPYEKTNRSIHSFNKGVDRAILRPVANTYSGIMGDEVEDAISQFSDNLSMPGAVVNNVLQGNMKGATEDTYRFVVNTTIGLLGFIDVATDLNMPQATDADFGETLAVWGVPEGAYVERPIFGPSTQRDSFGNLVDLFLNPLDYWIRDPEEYWTAGASVSSTLSQRSRFGSTIDSILYDSADSYAQARSLYLQNRRFEVGNSGSDDYLDPYDDPYLDLE
ncbi:MAG: VacJ family lipoprotein [Pseudomonadota bacterium]